MAYIFVADNILVRLFVLSHSAAEVNSIDALTCLQESPFDVWRVSRSLKVIRILLSGKLPVDIMLFDINFDHNYDYHNATATEMSKNAPRRAHPWCLNPYAGNPLRIFV